MLGLKRFSFSISSLYFGYIRLRGRFMITEVREALDADGRGDVTASHLSRQNILRSLAEDIGLNLMIR